MPQYRFTTIRDLNTFSTILQKNWVVEVECIAQNNPLLLLEDRMKIAATVEEKYECSYGRGHIKKIKLEQANNIIINMSN